MNPGAWLLVAALGLASGLGCAWRAPRGWLAFSLAGAAAGLIAAVGMLAGGEPWDWQPDFLVGGERVHLRLDALSGFFLALLAVVGGGCSVYSREYWSDAAHPRSAPAGRAWWSVLLLCLGLVLVASNGLHFLIAWEIFTIAAYFLITLERQKREEIGRAHV
jgi:hydrogenase-4 component B